MQIQINYIICVNQNLFVKIMYIDLFLNFKCLLKWHSWFFTFLYLFIGWTFFLDFASIGFATGKVHSTCWFSSCCFLCSGGCFHSWLCNLNVDVALIDFYPLSIFFSILFSAGLLAEKKTKQMIKILYILSTFYISKIVVTPNS